MKGFEANCLATEIGSLPAKDTKRAVDFMIEKLKNIPVWPQVSHRSKAENMMIMFCSRLPGFDAENAVPGELMVDPEFFNNKAKFTAEVTEKYNDKEIEYFRMEEDYDSGFFEFLSRKDELKDARAIKGQVTGYTSEGFSLMYMDMKEKDVDKRKKYSITEYDYGIMLMQWMAGVARWQYHMLRKITKEKPIIIFFDEPVFADAGKARGKPVKMDLSAVGYCETFEYLKELPGLLKGIHVCGDSQFDQILGGFAGLDIINFDAYDFWKSLVGHREIVDFFGKGGIVAWGLVPADIEIAKKEGKGKEMDTTSLRKKFEDILKYLKEKKGIPKEVVLKQSLITPQCGFGSLKDVDDALYITDLLNKLSAEIRSDYVLD